MKSTMTLKSITLIALLGAALAAPVLAQGGAGMGGGMGGGPGMQNSGQGGGAGMRQGRGPGRGMQFNQNNTPGWSMMTPEERTAQQIKMRSVNTLDECKAVQAEHRTSMEARAKEKGVTLRNPRQNGCDAMKSRGFIS